MKRIESIQNSKVKLWKKLSTKKGRDKEKSFLIEGEHVVRDALLHDVEIVEIIIKEGAEGYLTLNTKDIPVYEVSEDIMKALSDTVTPQGILAVCAMQKQPELTLQQGKYLLLDQIQDPGNLGTIIRTADSAGMDAVILGDGCVDRYNSKVIRSTQGSIFHIPIYHLSIEQAVQELQEKGIPVFGTALEEASSYVTVRPATSFGLILGNEANGVRKELLKQTTGNIYIPIYGKAESLNVAVAAGILMYHLRNEEGLA